MIISSEHPGILDFQLPLSLDYQGQSYNKVESIFYLAKSCVISNSVLVTLAIACSLEILEHAEKVASILAEGATNPHPTQAKRKIIERLQGNRFFKTKFEANEETCTASNV